MSDSKNDSTEKFSWKEIIAYLKGERKGRDANKLEQKASDDPFLNDAIDGYESFKDDSSISDHLKDIENYIEYRKSQEKGPSNSGRRILAIAASFAVLISASLWVWFSLSEVGQKDTLTDMPKIEKSEQEESIQESPAFDNEIRESIIEEIDEESATDTEQIRPVDKANSEPDLKMEEKEPPKPVEPGSSRFTERDFEKDIAEPTATVLSAKTKPDIIEEKSDLSGLLKQILEMEKEFWKQEQINSLAMNDLNGEVMEDQLAPAISENLEFEEKKSERKKMKSTRNMVAGAAASETSAEEPEGQAEAKSNILSPRTVADSLLNGNGIEKLDSLAKSEEYNLLNGINKLLLKDTTEAIEQLNRAIPKSPEQKVLIDSLLLKLSR